MLSKEVKQVPPHEKRDYVARNQYCSLWIIVYIGYTSVGAEGTHVCDRTLYQSFVEQMALKKDQTHGVYPIPWARVLTACFVRGLRVNGEFDFCLRRQQTIYAPSRFRVFVGIPMCLHHDFVGSNRRSLSCTCSGGRTSGFLGQRGEGVSDRQCGRRTL